jgi:hypothetical protein
MSFRLWTIFHVFALLAAAMATFGPTGLVIGALILGIWALVFYGPNQTSFRLVTSFFYIACLLLVLLLPSAQPARDAALQTACRNNLKQITQALMNYESVKGRFPPPYVADASGRPMHSWRVLILPYLGETALFNKYSFSEPWDGPNNRTLMESMPDVYACPAQIDSSDSHQWETNYFAIIGPDTGWSIPTGVRLRDIRDGPSWTCLLIEASGMHVNWMEPRDLTLDQAVELETTKPRSGHRHVDNGLLTTTFYETSDRHTAWFDGRVAYDTQLENADIAKGFFTATGASTRREAPPTRWYSYRVKPKATTVIKWGKVWSLAVFVILALLPATRLRRRASPPD